MFKTNAPDSVANRYVDKDVGGGTPGTKLVADDRNINMDELVNAVESSGQTLDPTGADREQLAQAMAIYGAGGGWFYTDSGIINDYDLTIIPNKIGPAVVFDGMIVMFKPQVTNNGAAVVTVADVINAPIVDRLGDPLTGGEIKGLVAAIYNITSGEFELFASGGEGARGGGPDAVFYENDTNVTTDYTITTGKNAVSAGPIAIDPGATVTVPTGSVWTVV